MVNFQSLPEHQNFDKYFGVWAVLYYPDMANRLKAKMANNEDYFEERHLLLLKLKQDGLQMLDSARIYYEKQLKAIEEEQRRINSLPAAPLNEYTIMKIFNTAKSIAISQYNLQIPNATPSIKQEIYRKAFINNGFNFSKTIHNAASKGFGLAEYSSIVLILIPYSEAKTNEELNLMFTEQELIDIRNVEKFISGK